jgi:hypothetical protein
MKSEGWIDVQIRTAVDAAELLGMLADPVIQGGWEETGLSISIGRNHNGAWRHVLASIVSILQGVDPDSSTERDIRVEELPIRIGIASGLNQSGRFGLVGGL